jgi:uncharacterized protein YkwD
MASLGQNLRKISQRRWPGLFCVLNAPRGFATWAIRGFASVTMSFALATGLFSTLPNAGIPILGTPDSRPSEWHIGGISQLTELERDGFYPLKPQPSSYCPTDLETEVVRLINQERTDRGLPALSIDVRLLEAARLHSEDMADQDYFSHTSLDGRSPWQRISDAGYPMASGGETIAAGYSTAAAVVQGWMNSSGHRAILLGSSYEHVGLGYAYDPDSTYGHYWTGDFGSASDGGKAPTGCTTFSDVPTDHWAFPWIEALYETRITSGCDEDPLRYCPDDTVTRAQMAVFLERGMRGSDYTPPPASGAIFDDVPVSHWAAAWIEQLASDGITSGCLSDPPSYCPGDSVSRAQIAVFLERASHWPSAYEPQAASGTIFADVPAGYWAANWIEQLYADEITSGCSEDPLKYCPETAVSRAEMAAFLVKAFRIPLP